MANIRINRVTCKSFNFLLTIIKLKMLMERNKIDCYLFLPRDKFTIFANKTNTMLDKFNYEDFFEESWQYVSKKIVSDRYFYDNQDFIRGITKDIFDIYSSSENSMSTQEYGQILESFFYNLFEYRPSQEKNRFD